MPILNPEHLQDFVLLPPLIVLQTGVEAGDHERKEVGIGGAIEALYDYGHHKICRKVRVTRKLPKGGWATQLEDTPGYTDFPDHEDFEPPSRETRKRWTRPSKSSSSSGRHRKRRGHTPVAAKSSTHRHYEEPEPEASHHRYKPKLLEVPNWVAFGVSGAGQVCDFGLLDTLADGAPVPTHTQGRREGEWESPWMESEAHMAEALLFGVVMFPQQAQLCGRTIRHRSLAFWISAAYCLYVQV
ncbi:hypothetical protein V8F33_009056 [Rhypophila sp. PSN 637]